MYTINVTGNGTFDQTALTLNVGDKILFQLPSGYKGNEKIIKFSPSTIPNLKLDHEHIQGTRTFSTAGSWTLSISKGGVGTVTVQ